MGASTQQAIVPRGNLDFRFDEDIPRYWLAGDAFRSRYLDALSTVFPEGEKYFITCVRHYRDGIRDPALAEQVRDFIRQEGYHGMVHIRFNTLLKRQGLPVEQVEARVKARLDGRRAGFSPEFNLAITAGLEHLTAQLADGLFRRRKTLDGADPRVRAMFAWHAVEEFEHRAVAYDVMQTVAKVGYRTRVAGYLFGVALNAITTFRVTVAYLKADGYRGARLYRTLLGGLWWLYKPGGFYGALAPALLAYLLPGFHPARHGSTVYYERWLELFARTQDPVETSERLHALAA